tara:strand:+ start:945 stop:1184 length:240 start_codon:yes stop_codon:yes gene_type:complete
MQLPKIFQAFKNLESKKKIIQEVLERSLTNFIEEIEMRFTMCGMLTKNNIYNSEIYAKKKRIFEKYPIMEDFLITDFSY